jgi:hypothetical protein
MSPQHLPPKREVMMSLLSKSSVYVHLDSRGTGVSVPPKFRGQPQLVLQIGLNLAVPIRDLSIDDEGFSCTLSFSRQPYFCVVPWGSVFAMVDESQRAMVWPDDVPTELAAALQSQAQAQQAKKKAEEDKAKACAWFRALDGGDSSESAPASSPAQPRPAPALAAVEPPAPIPVEKAPATPAVARPVTAKKPGGGEPAKRPNHLRLVK